MADNFPATGGSGYLIGTDDVGGVHYQKVKIAMGADGVIQGMLAAGQTTMANSVPVVIASDQPQATLITLADTTKAVGVVQTPHTTGGLSHYYNGSLVNTGVTVKASAGQLYGYYISNELSAADVYVKFYNLATAPTSASTPFAVYKIPKGGAANRSFSVGVAYSAGIGIRATLNKADSDDTTPGASSVILNLEYK